MTAERRRTTRSGTTKKSRSTSTEEIVITPTRRKKSNVVKPEVKLPQAKIVEKLPKSKVERAKARVKKQRLKLESNEDQVLRELESKVTPSDEQVYIKEYLYIYRRLKRLIRKADAGAVKSGRSSEYYALCTLISQQREVIADIRSISDLSGQVNLLLELALQPLVSNIGQALVNSFYQQRRLIVETSKPEETQFAIKKLDEITNDVTRALQLYYEQAAGKVQEILVGVPEEPKKKRKR